MEVQATETIYSLVGLESQLDQVLCEVTAPIRYHMHGPRLAVPFSPAEDEDAPTPPKVLLFSGKRGCGMRGMTSAIVNELRRGPRQKSADIFYKNEKVKFLSWDREPYDLDLADHFREILGKAKAPDDGRDFTVLLMERLHSVCPAEGNRRARRLAQSTLIDAMKEELTACPPGRILFVGSTFFPEEIDAAILNLVDVKLHFPLPDDTTREELIRTFLDRENAGISEVDMNFAVSSTPNYSPEDLRNVVTRAVNKARTRLVPPQDVPNNAPRLYVLVERRDLVEYLGAEEDEEGEEDVVLIRHVFGQHGPLPQRVRPQGHQPQGQPPQGQVGGLNLGEQPVVRLHDVLAGRDMVIPALIRQILRGPDGDRADAQQNVGMNLPQEAQGNAGAPLIPPVQPILDLDRELRLAFGQQEGPAAQLIQNPVDPVDLNADNGMEVNEEEEEEDGEEFSDEEGDDVEEDNNDEAIEDDFEDL